MPKLKAKKRFKYLKVNAVQCKDCWDVLVSMDTHHFVSCHCDKDPIFVDGGFDYTRWGGKPEKFKPCPLYLRVEVK